MGAGCILQQPASGYAIRNPFASNSCVETTLLRHP